MFKKGDIAARVTTTVAHYGFGSGRSPTKSHSIEIVMVSSAAKDGRVKSYQTSPASPVYKVHDKYGAVRWLAIGEHHAAARDLFATAASPLRFDDQEAAKAAILAIA